MTTVNRRTRNNNATAHTAGLQFLSSVLQHRAVSALRDVVDPDIMFNREQRGQRSVERRAYDFIREHFDEYRVLPTADLLVENTGIRLPKVSKDQPPAYYYRRLRARAFARNITTPFNNLSEALQAPRTSIDEMEHAIDEMYTTRNRLLQAGTGIEFSGTIAEQATNHMLAARMSGGVMRGITTGYAQLDAVIDGYNPEDLVVWVGRPGRSKSWFLLKQAYAAWTAGYKPLYVSMEMGAVQNMRRIMGIHTGVNPTFIKRGQIGTPALANFQSKVDELLKLRPMQMVTANFSRTVDQIANFVDQYTPDIVFIDAGYLLSPKKRRYGSSGRRETISDVIEELKELANNSGIPFVITVQFNRNAEQRRRGSNARRREGDHADINPIAHLSLAEIGETDVIGQAASHVLGIEYPPYPLAQNEYRVFGFLKGREGESGWWLTDFMEDQRAPVGLNILPYDHPAYQQIRNPSGQRRPGRQSPRTSTAMQLQD